MNRLPSNRKLENKILETYIKNIFEEHQARYGSDRIQKVLKKMGITINRKRIKRLMNQLDLFAKGSRKSYKNYTKRVNPSRPNLINQVFSTTGRNKVWVGDITYIPTKEGTLYLSTYIDIFSRKVVGFKTGPRMKESLVIESFEEAINKERPTKGLIIHTDQGSQYTGAAFQNYLRDRGFKTSNNRKGNPYDNALMESFYKTLKRELVNDMKFISRAQAQLEIFKYIETYYNTKRIHSSLEYMSPVEYERLHTQN